MPYSLNDTHNLQTSFRNIYDYLIESHLNMHFLNRKIFNTLFPLNCASKGTWRNKMLTFGHKADIISELFKQLVYLFVIVASSGISFK